MTFFLFLLCCFGVVGAVILFVEFVLLRPRDRRLAYRDAGRMLAEEIKRESQESGRTK